MSDGSLYEIPLRQKIGLHFLMYGKTAGPVVSTAEELIGLQASLETPADAHLVSLTAEELIRAIPDDQIIDITLDWFLAREAR